ncbi:hypothetical protein [Thalassoglobus polymorphus]|uniref:hypothetical protein n=1 Tax=Thalassoglobus polymorphus TaxID=2527994 RepID=UPI0018D22B02|nr:hypothetical protein [Thalassoglobus polymorphus]
MNELKRSRFQIHLRDQLRGVSRLWQECHFTDTTHTEDALRKPESGSDIQYLQSA